MDCIDKDLDYEKDVKIDQYSLEKCLILQPESYAKWNTAWAIAVKERDRAKDKLDLIFSKLAKKVREHWDILGLPKAPTEQMAKDWVSEQPEYQDQSFYLSEATFKVNVLVGAKQAFEHRSKALSDLVKLYLSGYYADEKMVGKEARELLHNLNEKSHEDHLNQQDQRKKLKRRK